MILVCFFDVKNKYTLGKAKKVSYQWLFNSHDDIITFGLFFLFFFCDFWTIEKEEIVKETRISIQGEHLLFFSLYFYNFVFVFVFDFDSVRCI